MCVCVCVCVRACVRACVCVCVGAEGEWVRIKKRTVAFSGGASHFGIWDFSTQMSVFVLYLVVT